MNGTNRVAATLAIMAMVGFLLAFFGLGWAAVPVANKDYLNQALIALIGLVGTAFGYYLGSSQGSAQKNALLAQTAPPAPVAADTYAKPAPEIPAKTGTGGEGGFARVHLLVPLAFLILFCAALVTMHGCATLKKETPQGLATKSLVTMKEAIVTAAVAGDALCKQDALGPEDCRRLAMIYAQAGGAYDLAADSLITAIKMDNAPDAWERYRLALLRFNSIFSDAMDLSVKLGLVKAIEQGGTK